jgi:serine/threonine protein kinase
VTECPLQSELALLLANPHDERAWELLHRHLDECPTCRQRIDTLTNVGDIVPGQASHWGLGARSSPALEKVISQLQLTQPVGPSGHVSSPGSAPRLPFLQPIDRAGFIGRLGSYEVRRVIGQGGMGIVLEAVDPVLKRTVAIKMLLPWTVLDDETKARFLREAQAAAALTHENVVAIHSVDQVDSTPFLVLEFVAGHSLEDRVKQRGRLAVDDVVRLGAGVARGLAAAHAKQLVHRDIKPANILLVEGTDRPKLADFGLARGTGEDALTVAGAILGTPEFMSPEQALGKGADQRSDLFSLGAVLYFASTGASPFHGHSLYETLDNVRNCQPRPLSEVDPTIPSWLCDLIHRMLARQPEDRPIWAAEVAALLEQSSAVRTVVNLPGKQPTVRISPDGGLSRSLARRWWLIAPLALVAAFVLVAGVGLLFRQEPTATIAPPPPQPRPPQPVTTGFAVMGSPEVFKSLAAALEASRDGDIIEVHGNGPFLTAPLTTAGKRLTIRAAVGSHPVLLMENPTARATAPLLRTDTDLRMEGLEIHWAIGGQTSGGFEADMLARSAIAATHGRLVLAHCQIVSDRFNGCVAGSCREVLLRNCHLSAKDGMGLFWRPTAGGRLEIDGTTIDSRFGMSLLVDGVALGTNPGKLRLSHSTLVADRGMQVLVETIPRQPLPFAVNHSVVAADYLFLLIGQRLARPKAGSKLEEIAPVLRSVVAWSEEANVYRRGMQFVGRPIAGRPGAVAPVDLVGIDRWLEMWKLPDAESIEGELVLAKASESSELSAPILAALSSPSGAMLPDVGAPSKAIGPGAAYHAWRGSPHYESWPADDRP